MVKICHITTVHPNRYDVRIFEKECVTLAKNGYEVTLIVNDKLQDISSEISFWLYLTDKLSDGKEIKAVLISGFSKVYCYIFVDNKLVLEN